MTKVLGLHATKSFYIQKEKFKTTKKPSLRHLSIFSVAEEGMTNSSPAVGGGAGSSAAGGGAVDAAEAAKGEIIATSAGANFFAFSKKAFISSWVWPWGELTFSQSKSAPCAKESAIVIRDE
jgi:hypothetical protein